MDILQCKTPKTITTYNNWKTKEINKLLKLKEDMITNNIEKKLIDIYMEEEYKKINDKYNIKIEQYYKNQEKVTKNENIKSINNKKI
jgi:hypothetical protein